jgi:hypothetical protein
MGETHAVTRDLIAYKIKDMMPLRLDEIVSGTGELS